MSGKIPCPACGSDTDDGLLCRRCVRLMAGDLAEIMRLLPQLDVTLSRQSRSGSGGKRTEIGLPLNTEAFKVSSYVRNQLQSWVRELDMGDLYLDQRGCWCRPYRACTGTRRIVLGDDPVQWCAWLIKRTERIRSHAASDEIASEFAYCRQLLTRAIDRPGDRVFCGRCEVCGQEVYADRGDVQATCRRCAHAGIESALPVESARSDMWAEAASRLIPRRLIMDSLHVYGKPVKPATWRQWIARGHLRPAGESNGAPLYLLQRVLDLAEHSKHRTPEVTCWICWARGPDTPNQDRRAA